MPVPRLALGLALSSACGCDAHVPLPPAPPAAAPAPPGSPWAAPPPLPPPPVATGVSIHAR